MDNDSVLTLVRLALDAASLRHQAIANNIANANSPLYTPLKVNFEEQLGFARDGLGAAGVPAHVKPFIEPEAGAAPGVRLDMEMVKLAQNTIHYQSLLKALDKRGAILAAAISEGRR